MKAAYKGLSKQKKRGEVSPKAKGNGQRTGDDLQAGGMVCMDRRHRMYRVNN